MMRLRDLMTRQIPPATGHGVLIERDIERKMERNLDGT
jgi:hypothetical protein